jgi:hypothetical protein
MCAVMRFPCTPRQAWRAASYRKTFSSGGLTVFDVASLTLTETLQ